MKPIVYIAKPVPIEVESFIEQHCQVRKWCEPAPIPRAHLLEQMGDVDGLFNMGVAINAELIACAPRLKVVSNMSVGYNNFDLAAMKARRIMGTNTPNVLDESVADLVFGLMLSAARRLPELDHYVKQGGWKKSDGENLYGIDVHHTTLGIIGMGRIGEAVARRARLGFGMDVLYCNRNRKPNVEAALGVSYCTLDVLLAQSDFIVLMTPLTPETEQLIGRAQFEKMKPSAIFINASRGETVNEAALVEALRNKQIRGAALDVFEIEPVDPAHPLLSMSNVVTVPHLGSATTKTRFDMAMLAAHNLVDAVNGKTPANLVPELQ